MAEENNLNLECPPELEIGESIVDPGLVGIDEEFEISDTATSLSQRSTLINSELFNSLTDIVVSGEPALPVNIGKFGDKNWYLLKNSPAENSLIFNHSERPVQDSTTVGDKLRYRLRNCWAYYKENLVKLDEYAEEKNIPKVLHIAGMVERPVTPASDTGNIYHQFLKRNQMSIMPVRENGELFFGSETNASITRWIDYVYGYRLDPDFTPTIQDNIYFYDLVFEMDFPFSKDFIKANPNVIKSFSFSPYTRYNFYKKNYEELTKQDSVVNSYITNTFFERNQPSVYNIITFVQNVAFLETIDTLLRPLSGNGYVDVNDFLNPISILSRQINDIVKMQNNFNIQFINAEGGDLRLQESLIDSFVEQLPDIPSTVLEAINQKQRNMVFLSGDNSLVLPGGTSRYNSDVKRAFSPINVGVRFDNKNVNGITSDYMVDTGYDISLIKECIQSIEGDGLPDRMRGRINIDNYSMSKDLRQSELHYKIPFQKISRITEEGYDEDKQSDNLGTNILLGDLRTWDLGNWFLLFDQYGNATYDQIDDDIITYLGIKSNLNPVFLDAPLDSEITLDSYSETSLNYFSTMMRDHIFTILEEKNRSWSEIINGKKAHCETIFYRIEKTDAVTEQKIQDYYFAVASDINIFDWIDDQLRYGKKYIYRVFSYQMVVGTKYKYIHKRGRDDYESFLQSYSDLTNLRLHFYVDYEPCLKLIEVPYFEFERTIIDNPPPKPVIIPYPYVGRGDRISFLLESGIGKEFEKPIIIFPDDEEQFIKIREAQGKDIEDEILFKSEDIIEFFDVFRIDHEPRGYSDFASGYKGRVDTKVETRDFEHVCSLKGNKSVFTDLSIKPNKKYYYMFRSIDVHEHVSNPSTIYEVELIKESSLVTPIIKIFKFPIVQPEYVQQFRRYLLISPSLNQTVLNKKTLDEIEEIQERINSEDYENTSIQEELLTIDPILSSSEVEDVWGEDFKVRVTSKSSGKKIDFNVKFKHKHNFKLDDTFCQDTINIRDGIGSGRSNTGEDE